MEKLAKFLFFVFLLVYFTVTVVSQTPAKVAANMVLQQAPGLSLSGVSGTVWSGKAGAAKVQIGADTLDLGGLSWDLDVWSLLGFKVCSDLKSQLIQGHVCRNLTGENALSQVMVDNIPASMFNNLVGAQLGGTASATIQNAIVTDQGKFKALQGNLTWMRARGNGGGGWFPLGSFGADVTDNGDGGIRGTIIDIDGEFEIKMEASYNFDGQPRVNGTIKPRANAPQALVDTLGVFTQALDDGSYRLEWPIGGG